MNSDLQYRDIRIHPDVAAASTLPSAVYLEPRFLEDEKRQIFWNTWQPIGFVEKVRNPGDFFAAEVQGEPVIVVCGQDGELRAFSNVCRHRASLILQGAGNTKSLQCPYHAWTYDLEGKLRGQPEFQGVKNWNKDEVSLPRIPLDVWGPYVFVHLERGTPKLEEMLGNIPEEIAAKRVAMEGYRFLHRREYTVQCNWKTYIDNYLEGYHLPLVHPQLFRELDYAEYRVDTYDYYSFQYAPMRPAAQNLGGERRYDPATGAGDALYYWIFPNFMVNLYPDNMSANIILPLGADRTLTIFDWFVPEEKLDSSRASLEDLISFSDQVQQEDIRICEMVQKGLASRSYAGGRFSAKRENGVHHFHRLIEKFMRGPSSRKLAADTRVHPSKEPYTEA